ncbi:DedA family protein [Goodfellowiella coeruleoviolacea]|uniref:Membrane protein DedA, SNARE-associated domain n=1 Tax=Goodfellowiella coeruleoviolacea TaxID=334858 RepID=A0AAE3GEA8_9PSEU|nr:DedA family protein [Goodfellowiella coeruleoviolacea]MCP2164548.1 membrane protein DedA, SNARE-associated domain [Goodfellowiella coeruleoviolacea]
MHIAELLDAVPPLVIYLIVGCVIGIESLGIPLPGEIVLVSASLMAAQHLVDPVAVGVAASAGAIIGDSIGYVIGKRGGRPLLAWLGRKFPKHFGPPHLAKAEHLFARYGVWAVFFGRFVALLRILAGPLAGALRMRYGRFLVANALGGIVWAGGTTAVIYYLGMVAEKWLQRFSWVGLVVAVLIGLGTTMLIRRRAARHHTPDDPTDTDGADAERAKQHAA